MSDLTPRITVVVADDHAVFRRGVVRALNRSPEVDVVSEVGTGGAALTAIRQLRPAVALLDYKMPELNGIEVLGAVTDEHLPTRVVLLSAFQESSLVRRALAEGACRCLSKDCDRSDILSAVIACAGNGGQ